jgi:hypothetical protein
MLLDECRNNSLSFRALHSHLNRRRHPGARRPGIAHVVARVILAVSVEVLRERRVVLQRRQRADGVVTGRTYLDSGPIICAERELLVPAPEDVLRKWLVSQNINSSRTPGGDTPLIVPIELAA